MNSCNNQEGQKKMYIFSINFGCLFGVDQLIKIIYVYCKVDWEYNWKRKWKCFAYGFQKWFHVNDPICVCAYAFVCVHIAKFAQKHGLYSHISYLLFVCSFQTESFMYNYLNIQTNAHAVRQSVSLTLLLTLPHLLIHV